MFTFTFTVENDRYAMNYESINRLGNEIVNVGKCKLQSAYHDSQLKAVSATSHVPGFKISVRSFFRSKDNIVVPHSTAGVEKKSDVGHAIFEELSASNDTLLENVSSSSVVLFSLSFCTCPSSYPWRDD